MEAYVRGEFRFKPEEFSYNSLFNGNKYNSMHRCHLRGSFNNATFIVKFFVGHCRFNKVMSHPFSGRKTWKSHDEKPDYYMVDVEEFPNNQINAYFRGCLQDSRLQER